MVPVAGIGLCGMLTPVDCIIQGPEFLAAVVEYENWKPDGPILACSPPSPRIAAQGWMISGRLSSVGRLGGMGVAMEQAKASSAGVPWERGMGCRGVW